MIYKTIDKEHLKKYKYKNDNSLMMRKRVYQYTYPKIDLTKEVIKKIPFKAKRVLDVGCGNGDLLISLRKSSFTGELFGMDLSEGIMQKGTKQSIEEGLNIIFKAADAESLPFKDEFFDVIIAKHMLYHVPNVQKAVNEVYRCLKKGGCYIVTLNSKNQKPKLAEYEQFIKRKYEFSIKHGDHFLVTENISGFLTKFKKVETIHFENKIELRDPSPFIDYIASFQDSYTPMPTKEVWQKILRDIKDLIQKEINEKGKFIEYNRFDLIKAIK